MGVSSVDSQRRAPLDPALGGPIYSTRGEITGYVGTIEDITERKQAHRVLQEKEALNRAVLNSLPANIVVLNGEWVIQAINEEWQRFAKANGDPPACFVGIGANYLEVCKRAAEDGSIDAQNALAGIQAVLAGKLDSFTLQYACNSPTEKKWFQMLVNPLVGITSGGVVITHLDITERKHSEERLRESEERFRNMADTAPVMIWIAGPDKGCMFFNKTWLDFTGRNMQQELGNGWAEGVHPDDVDHCVAVYTSSFDARKSFQMEYRLRRADGAYRWLLDNGIPRFTPANIFEGYIGSCVDITERRGAEIALEESRQELRDLAARLINAEEEERKRISRELHDDLGQKLALLAFDASDLVMTPSTSVEAMKEPLRNIQTGVVQISEEVRHLAHQLHPSVLEDLGLEAALRELCDEFSARTGIEATFEQDTLPESLPMEVGSCLYRVAQEALHNVSKHARASHVRIIVNGTPEGVRLSIRDNGAG